ncbi:hypothetical protein [Nitrososphaera viennensis]|uniref:Uncharacterized protein n=2 Tax=Nitrososphaera viennensis TaxID=1034015 RepID=A0A060HQP9_9ARCH|nr:hypothetical protein [Nitrososphaera viennensis]AIC15861.1 hypothetical protein NVIE_016090 [Nitrososphaera viennensis EN76]UVS67850.1 hypothetical protein NWT39_08010 [Nitrososphaera viennensis]
MYFIVAVAAGIALISGTLLAANNSQILQQPKVAAHDPSIPSIFPQTNAAEANQSLLPFGLTGKLSLYILPLEYGQTYKSGQIVDRIENLLPGMTAAHYSNLGVSVRGQYADEKVLITEQNLANLPEDVQQRYRPGDYVEMTVIKRPADTVKIYIDPAVKRHDGTPVTIDDISPDWQFGNGITCCGFSLKDGTDVSAVFFVVDQAYDAQVMKQLDAIKTAASNLTS